jgi:hypothetical protein
LLPRGVVDKVLVDHAEKVAALLGAQLERGFLVHEPEVVLVSKTRGRRPVAVLSVWERVVYEALIRKLEPLLPAVDRGRDVYEGFKNAPLESEGAQFVVMADIASCYQYIDHGLLETELVNQTGDAHAAGAISKLLETLLQHRFGLPQNRRPSDALAETVLSLVDRRLRRRSIELWRYSDDYRFAASTRAEAHLILETLEHELRTVGLVLNEEKTSIRSIDRYGDWASAVSRRIGEVEAAFDFDFGTFIDLGSSYDDEEEADDDGESADQSDAEGSAESDREVPVGVAVALLNDWATGLAEANVRARVGPDAVVDRSIVATSLRVLGKLRDAGGLEFCRRILDSDPSLTPQVARYFSRLMRHDESRVDGVVEEMLAADELYLSPWQALWLLEPLRSSNGLTQDQQDWVFHAFRSDLMLLRASAGHLLALQGLAPVPELLELFALAPVGARPKVVSALAVATGEVDHASLRAVTDGRPLYGLVAQAALDGT